METMKEDVRKAIESVLDNGKDYGIDTGQREVLQEFARLAVELAPQV